MPLLGSVEKTKTLLGPQCCPKRNQIHPFNRFLKERNANE